jgi:hypothetical protein
MKCGHIPDGDNLFRQSVFPVSFKGKDIFEWAKCLNIRSDEDGSLSASLTWERYVPTIQFVHGYGCRLALRRNEKKQAGGKFKEKDRHIYCGSYQLKAKAVRELEATEGLAEVLSADVVHEVEEGEIAHANMRIVLKPGVGLNVEGTKTAIVDRLWNTCSGPLRHTCDCDKEIGGHPSSKLETPPAGAYFDDRSYPFRLWHIIRFFICRWLWWNTCRRERR